MDTNNPLQLKLLVANSTLFIFSWDRVAECRVRAVLDCACFKYYGVSTEDINERIVMFTA